MNARYDIMLLIGAMASMSSCSAQKNRLTDNPLSGLQAAANARSGCIDLFRLRIDQSLKKVNIAGSKKELLGQVASSLPKLEKNAIEDVARVMAPSRGGNEIEEINGQYILTELSKRFAAANICKSEQPEVDLYVFADQLNLHLLERGVDTGAVFSASGNPTTGSETQRQILLSLVLYVQTTSTRKVH